MKFKTYRIGTRVHCIGGPDVIIESIIIRHKGAVSYECSYFKDGELMKLEMDSFLLEPFQGKKAIGYL